mmetsp:Transcript_48831/g.116259  ORF Transcript_48831/g.116259 Transcript_48831/m.116259 type:complete len:205 (+) Transcript_48831:1042-1656(+)
MTVAVCMISMISAITIASTCAFSVPNAAVPLTARACEKRSAAIGRHVFSGRSKNSVADDFSAGCVASPDPIFFSITSLIFRLRRDMSPRTKAIGSFFVTGESIRTFPASVTAMEGAPFSIGIPIVGINLTAHTFRLPMHDSERAALDPAKSEAWPCAVPTAAGGEKADPVGAARARLIKPTPSSRAGRCDILARCLAMWGSSGG